MSWRSALASIEAASGWSSDSDLRVEETPNLLSTALPISDMATAAYGALALAADQHHRSRGGKTTQPFVDRAHAGLAMAGNEYLTVDGAPPASWDPLTGYYKCGDDKFIYLHMNFPHHRDGALSVLGAAPDRDAVAAALMGFSAEQAEDALQTAGLCGMMQRSRPEWEAHPQQAALAAQPVVRIAQNGDSARQPGPAGPLPLSGVRVLDLTRVIAGPMAGRALAELGAEVIRISAPDLPHIPALVIDTGFGKRAAYADLTTVDGCETLGALIAEADILIDGFRPSALAAKGFGADALAEMNPALTVVTISAFSDVGPWAGRRGYDSYVQGGVGLTTPETPGDRPVRLPCQPLDYLTGCLSAFGAVASLTMGGGKLVEMSLARTAMWVWEMSDALPSDTPAEHNPSLEEAAEMGLLRRVSGPQGAISALAPPYGFGDRRALWSGPPPILGADPPEWLAD
ncbi:MAG: CoA transferase [Pseudomonadota bacterium]